MSHKKSYKILEIDPYLEPFAGDIELRMQNYRDTKARVLGKGRKLSSFANGHLYFGFHNTKEGWVYREWAPNAQAIYLFGDFNEWNRQSHPLSSLGDGIWEIHVQGQGGLPHQSRVRIEIHANGGSFARIPLYCRRILQEGDKSFNGQIWAPPDSFLWTDKGFKPERDLFIYESHVGMSSWEGKVSSYNEFTDTVLPRIKRLGYNTVQLMAVMEHPYYGSFGYQVSNFFAVSSRFGTPEELCRLINTAHGMGISVLLDIVHSHAARNEVEGIGAFDGTMHQFFHDGGKGEHPAWGTRLFNYGKTEVIHFLLSNIKFWLQEYHFDGFRFDGITSMLYHDHGLGGVFDNYSKYFSMNTDVEAVTYLQLAAELSKEVNPDCVLIAEDMSGMPGMCIPIEAGGIGFDYRLGMGMPDFWINTLRTKRDEDWNMSTLWHELSQRRPQEKVIGYCESHDQALVGDKTIIFWLADANMYWHMQDGDESVSIDRALSLHKMIRFITCLCAGEGYLNFMGNEFGHPEWIDFPREGNGWSYHYARRQWHLAEDTSLRYRYLDAFDKRMVRLVKESHLLSSRARLLQHHEDNKVLAFSKKDYVFVFNFSPQWDFTTDLFPEQGGKYRLVMNSNWREFGGYVDPCDEVVSTEEGGRLRIHLHKRCAVVYQKI